jgi:putative membrane protein
MTDRRGAVWDPGLQPERTHLAWQRTWLALLSAGLVAARLIGHHSVAAGSAIAAGSLLLAGGLGWVGSRRYAELHRELQAETPLGRGAFNVLVLGLFLVVGTGGLAYAWLVTG